MFSFFKLLSSRPICFKKGTKGNVFNLWSEILIVKVTVKITISLIVYVTVKINITLIDIKLF
jgi:hypothetical protein